MIRALRIALAIALALLAVCFGYSTLTVPMVAATAPAILMLVCGIGAWRAWPRTSNKAAA